MSTNGQTTNGKHLNEEARSMQVAEASRETTWKRYSLMKDMFLGRFDLNMLYPYPQTQERPKFKAFYDELKTFLQTKVDSVAIDATGEYPADVLDGLRKLGAFGMKVPEEYGGLGFNQVEYCKVMKLLGSHDGNICALLSAHQSIGVPRPVMLFGTEELKRKYLPRIAKGAISAFALTEDQVGSDPARLTTTALLSEDGTHYILNGSKLWCTNGTISELLVVMARNPKTDAISAFVVENDWPGVKAAHRCRFMGLKALANGIMTFENVKVPKENLIGEEGKGLKIALTTLNTGRLSLPAATSGTAKTCLEIVRKWGSARVQWGHPVGKHEAIGHKIADMAATTFAMEAISDLVASMADNPDFDIRLEAAAGKEWNTCRGWEIVDDTLQIRGGRGYETEQSLKDRADCPVPVERILRDSRINRIFEGSSEIMHLFMAREAVDKHLRVAGAMIDPKKTPQEKLAALPPIAAFYATWYPKLWLAYEGPSVYAEFGKLRRHLRFVARYSRKLAREIFHGMMVFQAGMQRKQAFLFRVVDIAMEMFAMAAACSRAQSMVDTKDPHAREGVDLADLFCKNARRKCLRLFADLWDNEDNFKYSVGKRVLEGKYEWLEDGGIGLGLTADQMTPWSKEAPKAKPPVKMPVGQ